MGVISIMETNSKYYQEIINKLEKLSRKTYLIQFLLGFQVVMFIVLMLLIFFSLFELITNLNSSLRTFLFYLAIVVMSGSAAYLLLIPFLRYFKLFRNESYQQVAKNVGKHFPNVKDDLLNSMQIVS